MRINIYIQYLVLCFIVLIAAVFAQGDPAGSATANGDATASGADTTKSATTAGSKPPSKAAAANGDPWWQLIIACSAFASIYIIPCCIVGFSYLHYTRMYRHITQNHKLRKSPKDFSAFEHWTHYPYQEYADRSLQYVKDTLVFSPRLYLSTETHSVLWSDAELIPALDKAGNIGGSMAIYFFVMLFCLGPTLGVTLGARMIFMSYFFWPLWNIPGYVMNGLLISHGRKFIRPAFKRQIVQNICVVTTMGCYKIDVNDPTVIRSLVDFERVKAGSATVGEDKKSVKILDENDQEIIVCENVLHADACVEAIEIALVLREKSRLVGVELILECLERHPVRLPELAVERIIGFIPTLDEVWQQKKRDAKKHNGKTEIINHQGEVIWRFDTHIEIGVESPSMILRHHQPVEANENMYEVEVIAIGKPSDEDRIVVEDIYMIPPTEEEISQMPDPSSPALITLPMQRTPDIRIRSPGVRANQLCSYKEDMSPSYRSSALKSDIAGTPTQ